MGSDGDKARYWVMCQPTDGAHRTSWVVKDRTKPMWHTVSQHRSESAALVRAATMNLDPPQKG